MPEGGFFAERAVIMPKRVTPKSGSYEIIRGGKFLFPAIDIFKEELIK